MGTTGTTTRTTTGTRTPRRRRGAVRATALAAAVGAAAVLGPVAAPASTPAAATAGTGAEVRPDPAVQRVLDRLVTETGLPGVLASVRGSDGRVRTYTAGSGDLRTGAPVPEDGRVRIASNTKTFTATVVLQLVAEGAVELDAPVERYLPGVVRGPGGDGRRTTVRHLLQQTSGLPDYDGIVIEAGGTLRSVAHTYLEPRQLVDAALAERRTGRPGGRWEYSNTNYVLLGLLVQRVTGRPFGEEVTRRIIEPLGLEDTYWPREGEQGLRGSHPRGYLADGPGGAWRDITRMDPSLGWAAGQLVSTPEDLGRFTAALLDGRLLPPAQLAAMRRTVSAPGFDAEPGWRYGLGLASHRLDCGPVGWGHGGDVQGFQTRGLATDDGRWAMVAVNGLPTSLEELADVSAAVETALCRS
ncbi:serine hydrolase domain-containing protein [Vallicoccus soli]|uniref:Class A beta-lactamase-related serine hydrolase n=1 Tax=Vallicoccus soli TaxID=2339232 RepID=A0A3A3YVK6_9ACTN|nr:serine hydrolase domain-containing protein [Vallicoccus soli]RJK94727.1 class A beta-lactamase-related serine hydrolase [Vallicoccus soli]